MFSLFIMSSIIMIIALMVMLLATILSKKSIIDRAKSSPFECGFDPKNSSRLPFSLKFFLLYMLYFF